MTSAPAAAHPLRLARRVHVHHDLQPVVVLLEVDGRDLPVELPLTPRDARSLRLLSALHERDPHPHATRALHVDLLVRALEAGGQWRPHVVVRPGPTPAFWLRMERSPDEAREVDLGTLDAIVLLLANRVPVMITTDHDPWDAALDRLREEQDT
jgi:hypothetical protein